MRKLQIDIAEGNNAALPEHFTLYSDRYETQPDDEMALLAKDGVDLTIEANGETLAFSSGRLGFP